MKKVLIGATLGIAVGYIIRKMQEEHQFDKLADCANKVAAKTKKQVKDVVDIAQNEAEYVMDRAEYAIEKGKAKLGKATDKEQK